MAQVTFNLDEEMDPLAEVVQPTIRQYGTLYGVFLLLALLMSGLYTAILSAGSLPTSFGAAVSVVVHGAVLLAAKDSINTTAQQWARSTAAGN